MPDRSGERIGAAAAAAVLHVLLALALIAGFSLRVQPAPEAALRTFDVAPDPPPPPAPSPSESVPGEPAPSGPKARPTPVVVPLPLVPVPSPMTAAPEPLPEPTGSAAAAGASTEGSGTGAGGAGSGAGGGGAAIPARRLSGRLSGATDYPPAARRAGIEGTVSVRYVVRTDGRASDCRVIVSSGHAELDSTTCRLIERRFRYRPARDARGRPVTETVSRTFDWLLPFRR